MGDGSTLSKGSTVVPDIDRQPLFIAASDEVCDTAAILVPWIADDKCRTLLSEIARRSTALLMTTPTGAPLAELTGKYRMALMDRHFPSYSTQNPADLDRLDEAFAKVFAPIRYLMPVAAVPDKFWLNLIIQERPKPCHPLLKSFHPLLHVLFGIFLDSHPSSHSEIIPTAIQSCTQNTPSKLTDNVSVPTLSAFAQ